MSIWRTIEIESVYLAPDSHPVDGLVGDTPVLNFRSGVRQTVHGNFPVLDDLDSSREAKLSILFTTDVSEKADADMVIIGSLLMIRPGENLLKPGDPFSLVLSAPAAGILAAQDLLVFPPSSLDSGCVATFKFYRDRDSHGGLFQLIAMEFGYFSL